MDPQILHERAMEMPHVTLTHPFGGDVNVYKVLNKMFALTSVYQQRPIVNLKCDPQQAIELCDVFTDIIPGYHMNKRHWITVFLDGSVPQGEIERMMDNSFKLVVSKMTKKDQQSILVHL